MNPELSALSLDAALDKGVRDRAGEALRELMGRTGAFKASVGEEIGVAMDPPKEDLSDWSSMYHQRLLRQISSVLYYYNYWLVVGPPLWKKYDSQLG